MISPEMEQEIEQQLEGVVSQIVLREMENLSKPENIEKLTEIVTGSVPFRRQMNELQTQGIATEIGNRLRCGCWDASLLDRAFEAAWTAELQKALIDRVQSKVDKAIDGMILDKLKKLTSLLETSRS